MFQFDPTLLPSLRTRKALLIIDLQHDFVAPDGALPVTNPKGFIQRTVDVADTFRQSGEGVVVWVQSEFERHRPVENEQILTADIPLMSSMRSSVSRGRRPGLERMAAGRAEADAEAFLSLPPKDGDRDGDLDGEKPECVRRGTPGSSLALEVSAAIDPSRDSILIKTHYSAFQSGQLLQLLRKRFATEVYVCGVLTNISIHATALDAASHGIAVTLIDDCCGYRNEVRHTNAVRNLTQLTGCETTMAADMISQFGPKLPAPMAAGPVVSRRALSSSSPSSASSAGGPPRTRSSPKSSPLSSPRNQFVRDTGGHQKPPPPPRSSSSTTTTNTNLPEAFEELKLNDTSSSSAAAKSAPSQPQTDQQPIQPLVASSVGGSKGKGKSKEKENEIERGDERKQATSDVSRSSGVPPRPVLSRASSAHRESGLQGGGATSTSESPSQPMPAAKKDQEDGRSSSSATAKGVEDEASEDRSSPKRPLPESKKETKATPQQKIGSSQAETSKNAEASTTVSDATSSDEEEPIGTIGVTGETITAKMTEGPRPVASEPLCEGDTTVFHDILPPSLAEGVFERLRDEVRWLRMSHQGGEVPRLVCVQGEVDAGGDQPVYRHPSDESPPLVPFTPTVLDIKEEVEKTLGHGLNHVLIQFYRSGNDYISEHSDKTLDIVRGSFIANVSLGAERTMVFRTKREDKDPSRKMQKTEAASSDEKAEAVGAAEAVEKVDSTKRRIERARLPHNSLCRMGLRTNEKWLHAIRQDKRLDRDKTPAELAFEGGRISLTFRRIGTFLDRDSSVIWGQGATCKTRDGARPVVNGQSDEAVRMLRAFGSENHSSDFDWEGVYGAGFDVLHISNSPRFFSSGDAAVDMRIRLMLAEFGVSYAKGSMGPAFSWGDGGGVGGSSSLVPVKFVDNDAAKSAVQGDVAIMLYLDGVHGGGRKAGAGAEHPPSSRPGLARRLTRFQQALVLLDRWRTACRTGIDSGKADEGGAAGAGREPAGPPAPSPPAAAAPAAGRLLKPLARDLAVYEAYASETAAGGGFIAGGGSPSLADFALWPVLHDMASACGGDGPFVQGLEHLRLGRLAKYYESFGRRGCVRRVLGLEGEGHVEGGSDGGEAG